MKQHKSTDEHSQVDRRGFLRCMTWAGTGLIWTVNAGIPTSRLFGAQHDHGSSQLTFAQISDSHIGFSKPANPDVTATLQEAVSKINELPHPPAFLIHTGDLTHLSKPSEFDTLAQVLKSAKTNQVFYVPGEHDMLTDNGQQYLERYGKGTKGAGWYSFDQQGVHFVGLVNVADLKAGGLGTLGAQQLAWLKDDLAGHTSSTPIVVFAHIPLWTVYPEWGWGTDDSTQALSYLKHFGSVTVLNGHIHQVMQKVEGHVSFHTAMSTAFPQPKPGTAPSPGPQKVPASQLRSVLGITEVNFIRGQEELAIIDKPLMAKTQASASGTTVAIDNFSFAPQTITVNRGAKVTWINHDDIPHNVVSTEEKFHSKVLDTNDQFEWTFAQSGTYSYFCKIHPKMTGKVVVS